MSTSFQFTSADRGHSVISLARSATELEKLQEFVSKNTVRFGQTVVIDSEEAAEVILSHQDELLLKSDEAKHEEVEEKEAITKQELEKWRATKSNV